MSSVLIIGNGVVGRNLRKELAALQADVYDKYRRDENSVSGNHYELAFVCVPAQEARDAINENDADLYVVKSTLLPGATESLRNETGKRVIFSPEYYGASVHANNFRFDFTVLGGERADCLQAIQILQRCYDGRHRFRVTDAKTAELVKHMENAFLATKVSFCCQFWEIARQIGVDYPELRELFLLDPRVNPSHTFVFDKHPYWNTRCFNHDVPTIAEAYDTPLLKSVIAYNERNKRMFEGGK